MTLYTTDVDDVYDAIHGGSINAKQIHILSSKLPQSLQLLEDFPNIEEILCAIVCPISQLSNLGHLIRARPQLKIVEFLVYIPNANYTIELPPTKRQRNKFHIKPYQIALEISVPNIIRLLGVRMRYLFLRLTVCDIGTNECTTLALNKGNFYAAATAQCYTFDLFRCMFKTGSLRGLSTDGDVIYNLEGLCSLPELTIFPHTSDYSININYLKSLIKLAEVVTIAYDPETIRQRYVYSNIIKQGTTGLLKHIRAIVPVRDVEDHIESNNVLEEIHILVRNEHEVADMKDIIEKYQHQPITYYIYYNRSYGTNYWDSLKYWGDVVFRDIIRALLL